MSYLLRTKSINNYFSNEMITERMIRTLVVRQKKNVSQCCYGNITCYKCNRTKNNKQFSQLNNLRKCSININQNSKFLTTKISESSVCST